MPITPSVIFSLAATAPRARSGSNHIRKRQGRSGGDRTAKKIATRRARLLGHGLGLQSSGCIFLPTLLCSQSGMSASLTHGKLVVNRRTQRIVERKRPRFSSFRNTSGNRLSFVPLPPFRPQLHSSALNRCEKSPSAAHGCRKATLSCGHVTELREPRDSASRFNSLVRVSNRNLIGKADP